MLNEEQLKQLKEFISNMVREELKKFLKEGDPEYKKMMALDARDDAYKALKRDSDEEKKIDKDKEFRKSQRNLGRNKRNRFQGIKMNFGNKINQDIKKWFLPQTNSRQCCKRKNF